MNGKGSKQRPTNKARFNANYDQIDWGKSKFWPTLEGRLANPITSTKEALIQLKQSVPITDAAQKILDDLS